ncbi:nuclear pore complex Nup133, partial [Pelobates cultripes]
MFPSPRTQAVVTARRQLNTRVSSVRKSVGSVVVATSSPSTILSPVGRRVPNSGFRTTASRVVLHPSASETVNYNVQLYGSPLPIKVMEVLTSADADERLTVKIHEDGWAWLVYSDRLIIWKISQTSTKLMLCKELQLPASDYKCTADLVDINIHITDGAHVQTVAVLMATREGSIRFWPNLMYESFYTETHTDFGDSLCEFVTSVKACSYVLSSSKNQLVRLFPDASGKITQRVLQQGQGMLSGIGRRVSSLFGMLSPAIDSTIRSVLWDKGDCLYTLSDSTINKWEMDETSEYHVLCWEMDKILKENISNAIWGSGSNHKAVSDEINIEYLDLRQNMDGLVILAAAWHSRESPCLIYFTLVTVKDEGYHVSDEVVVEVTRFNPPFQVHEMGRKCLVVVMCLRNEPAYKDIQLFKACIDKSVGNSLGPGSLFGTLHDDKAALGRQRSKGNGDNLLGAGSCAGLTIFFARKSGLLAIVARENMFMLPEDLEESITSLERPKSQVPFMETPSRTETLSHDRTKLLKAAFLQYCRKDLLAAQNMADNLFPQVGGVEFDSELDEAVVQLSLDLIDDYPAADPRWADSLPEETAGVCNTSLIILHQLEDKMKAHSFFMDFLHEVGLFSRLSTCQLRGNSIATSLLLCEHAEKLSATIVLKNHHTRLPVLLNAAIHLALNKRLCSIPQNLTAADVYFREVSQMDLIFESLQGLEDDPEEETTQSSAGPGCGTELAEVQSTWGLAKLYAPNVIYVSWDMLHAAFQYRQNKASLYKNENLQKEPEIVQWTDSSSYRMRSLRGQNSIALKSIAEAEGQFRLVVLEDRSVAKSLCILVEDQDIVEKKRRRVNQSSRRRRYCSLSKTPRVSTSFSSIRKQKHLCAHSRRPVLLAALMTLGQYTWAISLAEKYCEFDILVQICELTENHTRLQQYMTRYSDQKLPDFLFRWYLEKGKRGKLLSQPISQHGQLASFLQAHEGLSWLHEVNIEDFEKAHRTLQTLANIETRYFCKKRTLLGMSKLAVIASDLTEDILKEKIEEISEEEIFLLHQETLPSQLLEEKQLNLNVMPVLSALALIKLYISEENRKANEYDFKKALDLLDYINEETYVDKKELKLEILCKAIKRDNWSSLDGTDDPIDATKDSIFVKVLQQLLKKGTHLGDYLPEGETLLQSDELSSLRSNAYFEYVLKANYEYY